MEELLYIKSYYQFFLVILILVSLSTLLGYLDRAKVAYRMYTVLGFIIIGFTIYYIGNREDSIGVDTKNYLFTFTDMSYKNTFEIRKDILFDFIVYTFSKLFTFNTFLTFCAVLYVGLAALGYWKIFRWLAIFPLCLFLISPNFFQFGINVMRNGVAASIFIFGIGLYYKGSKSWTYYFTFCMSILMHLSMILPTAIFLLVKYVKNTKFLVAVWLLAIIISLLNISLLGNIISFIDIMGSRFGGYLSSPSTSTDNPWANFLTYGSAPILVGLYFKYIRNFKDAFFDSLLNTYIIMSSIYVLLIRIEFSIRIAYLSEFLMPIILIYPLIHHSKVPFKYFKLAIGLVIIFTIKAFRILTIN